MSSILRQFPFFHFSLNTVYYDLTIDKLELLITVNYFLASRKDECFKALTDKSPSQSQFYSATKAF